MIEHFSLLLNVMLLQMMFIESSTSLKLVVGILQCRFKIAEEATFSKFEYEFFYFIDGFILYSESLERNINVIILSSVL